MLWSELLDTAEFRHGETQGWATRQVAAKKFSVRSGGSVKPFYIVSFVLENEDGTLAGEAVRCKAEARNDKRSLVVDCVKQVLLPDDESWMLIVTRFNTDEEHFGGFYVARSSTSYSRMHLDSSNGRRLVFTRGDGHKESNRKIGVDEVAKILTHGFLHEGTGQAAILLNDIITIDGQFVSVPWYPRMVRRRGPIDEPFYCLVDEQGRRVPPKPLDVQA